MPANASNGSLMIMVYVKAIVVIIIVGTIAYCTISQIPIDGVMEKIILAALAGKELWSMKLYAESEHKGK